MISRDVLEDAVEEDIRNDCWTGMFKINYDKLVDVDECKVSIYMLEVGGGPTRGTFVDLQAPERY